MTETENKVKMEITQNEAGAFDYHGNGGDILDHLAILSGIFVQLCKDNELPVIPLIKANFYELSESTDNLKDYLSVYSDEEISKIRAEKMQLVTAIEFQRENSEKLAALRELKEVKEQLNTAKKALTELKALLRDMNRECDGLSEPEEALYNIIQEALAGKVLGVDLVEVVE
ncbi:hypothetical protein [Lactococcus allomyrinae]|uniref:Uncharacterized protein n=1 Tax=Lactococcus allomyrinae TaxID=2419773 RepID=A0A387BGE3_9LACT|nr:hypothetical protein [Lactococcus allomyrinae]AYG01688.1 hypothetical protein D7I46_11865 [Lactococcus allomyrinae]